MVKSRFTSTDIAAMVAQLRPVLLGSRVVNVYDIGGKLFMIKFSSSAATANTGEEEDAEDISAPGRNILLIESGIRFHLTQYERKKSPIPSGWTMNIRKLIKNKQLEKIDQVGVDRVVNMQFGVGEKAIHVVLEMYAKGNIVVTDFSGKILLLLRSYQLEDGIGVAKNETYPIERAANVVEPLMPGWQSVLSDELTGSSQPILEALKTATGGQKKKKDPIIISAERLLGRIIPFAHSSLIEMALLHASKEEGKNLENFFANAAKFSVSLLNNSASSGGGFISKKPDGSYMDFAPTESLLPPPVHYAIPSATFSKSVDEFFHIIEQQSEGNKIESQRKSLLSRVDNIKDDQMRRIGELEMDQEKLWIEANVLEQNLDIADSAILILNTLIAKQLSWPEIYQAVEVQKRMGHSIAQRMGDIDFKRNRLELLLEGEHGDYQAENEPHEEVSVWLDLDTNAAGNVSRLHMHRKAQKKKLSKTVDNANLAIKQAEQKLKTDITKFNDTIERSRHLSKVRRRFWFEKFFWFITSENYLVIAGRDATQNEAIYKKYLKLGDVYVHADIHGAATVVVKNHLGGEIPPLSLSQAGQFSLCHSSAWNSKIVTSAWWVKADQVSKTAPSGEYLTTGSFMIRGKKNFLPPSRLELGMGVLFFLSEDSAKNHPIERKVRGIDDENPQADDLAEGDVEMDDSSSDEEMVSIVTTDVRGKTIPVKKAGAEKKATAQAVAVVSPPPKAPVSARTERLKKKQKKKDKYEWSDEEESESEKIRKELLGIKIADEVVAPVSEPTESIAAEASLPESKQCYKCGATGHISATCPLKSSQQPQTRVTADLAEEEDPTANLNVLDRLVASIVSSDELLHAVPVVGPYSAVSYYPHRMKIIPGSTKRGKAAKLCTQVLANMSNDTTQKSLIKSIPVEELSECLVPEVKLVAPGIQKLKVENKKAAKKSAANGAGKK